VGTSRAATSRSATSPVATSRVGINRATRYRRVPPRRSTTWASTNNTNLDDNMLLSDNEEEKDDGEEMVADINDSIININWQQVFGVEHLEYMQVNVDQLFTPWSLPAEQQQQQQQSDYTDDITDVDMDQFFRGWLLI
jgi:hypothetical protein